MWARLKIKAYSPMVMTMARPRVLLFGLDPYRVPGPWDPEPVAKRIAAGLARFAEHGVEVEVCLLGIDGSDNIDEVVSRTLRGEVWQCVVIGGGLRSPDDQVELLELVVNLIRLHAPTAALAFSSAPSDTFDAAARWLNLGPGKR